MKRALSSAAPSFHIMPSHFAVPSNEHAAETQGERTTRAKTTIEKRGDALASTAAFLASFAVRSGGSVGRVGPWVVTSKTGKFIRRSDNRCKHAET